MQKRHIELVEQDYRKTEIPEFKAGDTVVIHVKVPDEKKSKGRALGAAKTGLKAKASTGGKDKGKAFRIQLFKGIVIARKGFGLKETFTVRKISYKEGVERIFPLHSPSIEKIEVFQRGRVRRAKLYYLRNLTGKKARIKEDMRARYSSK